MDALRETGDQPRQSDKDVPQASTFAPLRNPTFRSIWSSSVLSNFGHLILGVGAAWEMTRLASSAEMVALVQTALMMPIFLIAVPAGAIADMFDRRKVAMGGLAFASFSAVLLTILAALDLLSPWLLLGATALISCGVALYAPAWQASIREQVEPVHLPQAVALGSISYNVARSFGPALGGVIVVAFGAVAAFGINAICFWPLIIAFFLWKRDPVASRLPPERIDRAIVAGARYAINSPPIRTVLIRILTFGFVGASLPALTPIIARDLLGGNAATYGILLGVYGIGAVIGALRTQSLRDRLGIEKTVSLCAAITGVTVVVMGLSRDIFLTCAAMAVAGAAWMLLIASLNVSVQLSAPRWVTGRALSWFQSMLTGGLAFGAWVWGDLATRFDTTEALIGSGIALVATPLIGRILPLPKVSLDSVETVEVTRDPDVAMALTNRSGPIVIEIDYRVDAGRARDFYAVMLEMQQARKRNGAFDWSISRNVGDPELWTERFQFPTWGDYLRQRTRYTQSDRELQEKATAFHMRRDGEGERTRRRLERPFGSVRYRAETPDPKNDPISIYTP